MQIDIRIIPFYEKSFETRFPRISDLLKQTSYEKSSERELSLYELVEYIVSLSRDGEVPLKIRQKVEPFVSKMLESKNTAREHLLARRLNELDQFLYEIEDQFEDLEDAL
jgi:hypothetical protein